MILSWILSALLATNSGFDLKDELVSDSQLMNSGEYSSVFALNKFSYQKNEPPIEIAQNHELSVLWQSIRCQGVMTGHLAGTTYEKLLEEFISNSNSSLELHHKSPTTMGYAIGAEFGYRMMHAKYSSDQATIGILLKQDGTVISVLNDSIAARAAMRPLDVITTVAGKEVQGSNQIFRALANAELHSERQVGINRGGYTQVLKLRQNVKRKAPELEASCIKRLNEMLNLLQQAQKQGFVDNHLELDLQIRVMICSLALEYQLESLAEKIWKTVDHNSLEQIDLSVRPDLTLTIQLSNVIRERLDDDPLEINPVDGLRSLLSVENSYGRRKFLEIYRDNSIQLKESEETWIHYFAIHFATLEPCGIVAYHDLIETACESFFESGAFEKGSHNEFYSDEKYAVLSWLTATANQIEGCTSPEEVDGFFDLTLRLLEDVCNEWLIDETEQNLLLTTLINLSEAVSGMDDAGPEQRVQDCLKTYARKARQIDLLAALIHDPDVISAEGLTAKEESVKQAQIALTRIESDQGISTSDAKEIAESLGRLISEELVDLEVSIFIIKIATDSLKQLREPLLGDIILESFNNRFRSEAVDDLSRRIKSNLVNNLIYQISSNPTLAVANTNAHQGWELICDISNMRRSVSNTTNKSLTPETLADRFNRLMIFQPDKYAIEPSQESKLSTVSQIKELIQVISILSTDRFDATALGLPVDYVEQIHAMAINCIRCSTLLQRASVEIQLDYDSNKVFSVHDQDLWDANLALSESISLLISESKLSDAQKALAKRVLRLEELRQIVLGSNASLHYSQENVQEFNEINSNLTLLFEDYGGFKCLEEGRPLTPDQEIVQDLQIEHNALAGHESYWTLLTNQAAVNARTKLLSTLLQYGEFKRADAFKGLREQSTIALLGSGYFTWASSEACAKACLIRFANTKSIATDLLRSERTYITFQMDKIDPPLITQYTNACRNLSADIDDLRTRIFQDVEYDQLFRRVISTNTDRYKEFCGEERVHVEYFLTAPLGKGATSWDGVDLSVSQVAAIWLSEDEGPVIQLLGPSNQIAQQVEECRSTISEHGEFYVNAEVSTALKQSDERQLAQKLNSLHKVLIESCPFNLQSYKSISIAPDGFLYKVPFAALVTSTDTHSTDYLIESHDIEMCRSVFDIGPIFSSWINPDFQQTSIFTCSDRKDFLTSRTPNTNFGKFRNSPDASTLLDIPEVELLQQASTWGFERDEFKRPNVFRFAGPAASELAFMLNSRSRNIFVAAHGLFDPASVSASRPFGDSALLLSSLPAQVSPQLSPLALDGDLTAYEISQLPMESTRLVALACCNTALGSATSDDLGPASIRLAFQLAGAHNVIASLWELPTAQTVELFSAIASQIPSDTKPTEASSIAQRNQIRTLRTGTGSAHPYFWGGLQCFTISTGDQMDLDRD